MKTFLLVAIISATVISVVNATPQRNRRQVDQSQNEDLALQKAFNSNNSGQQQQQHQQQPQSSTQSSRSAFFIVTPDPTYVPTTVPQTGTVNQQNCTCVPYHLCDPNSNTNTVGENENEVTGFGKINVQFDPLDCVDVLDVCCVGVAQREESIVPKPKGNVPTQLSGCGIRNVGGLDFELAGAIDNEAGFGEFPWTVALIQIGEYNKYICGGSLIHPKAVLTGFHCVKDYVTKPKDLKIRAGEWDTQTTKERLPYQERIVSRVLGHPDYKEGSLAFDFAIIELEDPFQMDRHISTICLPPPGFVPNQQDCFASGWGKDNFGQEGQYSVIMKKVPLGIVERNQCERALQIERLGDKFRLDGSFVCAGGVEGVDTCQGDGGAPLVCPIGRPSDNRFAQNGIVAWGLGCKKAIPAVYANVPQARDWIDSQVQLIGLDTSYYTFRG